MSTTVDHIEDEKEKDRTRCRDILMRDKCLDFIVKFGLVFAISVFCMIRVIQIDDETRSAVYVNILSGVIGFFLPSPTQARNRNHN